MHTLHFIQQTFPFLFILLFENNAEITHGGVVVNDAIAFRLKMNFFYFLLISLPKQ